MANSDDRFVNRESGSSSPGRRQTAEPSSLESDDVGVPLSHHSSAGSSSQGSNVLCTHNIVGRTQQAHDIGGIGQKLASISFTNRIQQPSDSIEQSSGASGLCSSVQQSNCLDDTLKQLSCAICFVRWLNLVVKTCRHLNCDVCYSRGPSFCGICRGEISGIFPIRFHSTHMIEDIDIPIVSEEQGDQINKLMEMGFQQADIRRAIRHTTDGLDTIVKFNSIIEYLAPSDDAAKTNPIIQKAYSIPTPEELEYILKDPKAKPEDKSRLVEWLRVTAKCLICKDKSPDICLLPCYHLAICMECHEDTQKRPQHCPDSHCGKKVQNQVKIHP